MCEMHEWTQTASEAILTAAAPTGTKARDIRWHCTPSGVVNLTVKGEKVIDNKELVHQVVVAECEWELADAPSSDRRLVRVTMPKRQRCVWSCFFKGEPDLRITDQVFLDLESMDGRNKRLGRLVLGLYGAACRVTVDHFTNTFSKTGGSPRPPVILKPSVQKPQLMMIDGGAVSTHDSVGHAPIMAAGQEVGSLLLLTSEDSSEGPFYAVISTPATIESPATCFGRVVLGLEQLQRISSEDPSGAAIVKCGSYGATLADLDYADEWIENAKERQREGEEIGID